MKLEPRNKRLVLEAVKSSSTESSNEFVGLAKKKLDNIAYRVLHRSDDCTVSVHAGDVVLVKGNMVEESKVGDSVFLTCKENFVIGLLKD